MTKQIVAKQGDTAPDVAATLSNASGPQDLSGATVQWRIKLKDGTGNPIVGPCALLDQSIPANWGKLTHDLVAPDTLTPGLYIVEYLVTWSNNDLTTFPQDYANTFKVRARGTV